MSCSQVLGACLGHGYICQLQEITRQHSCLYQLLLFHHANWTQPLVLLCLASWQGLEDMNRLSGFQMIQQGSLCVIHLEIRQFGDIDHPQKIHEEGTKYPEINMNFPVSAMTQVGATLARHVWTRVLYCRKCTPVIHSPLIRPLAAVVRAPNVCPSQQWQ